VILQEVQDFDSFGHTIIADEEVCFDIPFLTNDQVEKSFLPSDNQVRIDIKIVIIIFFSKRKRVLLL